jgi:hypothetical protein
MEALMRTSLKFMTGICALACAISYAAAANANPYYNHYTDGSWTNTEYNDGNCHIYYSHNAYDGETHINRNGNCANVAIGPNGEAMPLAPGSVVHYPRQ